MMPYSATSPSKNSEMTDHFSARSHLIKVRSGTYWPRQLRRAMISRSDAFHSLYRFSIGKTNAVQKKIPTAVESINLHNMGGTR